ncbi:hypothetical protein [Peribacillus glennii]|uniref:Uncharacterized protein n=1 Tax=Peribacillus glennii TaxID=2303991 RepID=A0A372LG28_9BACI|nr:hypothetical protein [Peribacillus glennii]RFU65255.1 hypothetical protein D0466_04970 [Peribacillus glennii]
MQEDQLKNADRLSDNKDVQKPIKATGTNESGFDWATDGAKLTDKPKNGDTLTGDDGFRGRLR